MSHGPVHDAWFVEPVEAATAVTRLAQLGRKLRAQAVPGLSLYLAHISM